ncbi:uncharacterized protein LOC144916636 [Branchiostoma floridae x Branchiostoma belcheri]
MGRKLRHVLVFLLIILKEPSMPEAACRSKCNPNSCSCREMGLTSIPQNLPKSITELYLIYNRITTVSHPDLVRYRNVIKVTLSYNQITNIHTGTFENLPRLQELYLSENQITKIESGTFVNLPALQKLSLRSNQLTMIQTGTFVNLPGLQWLDLSYNQLTKIESGTLANLPLLQTLFLSSNQITMIQSGAFVNLPQLQLLYLYHNQLTIIQTGTFENLPGLQDLSLSWNNITMIQSGTFANLTQLQKLYLSYNLITTIRADALVNLPQLQKLYLYCNQLTMIQSGTFENLPRLQELSLKSNQIKMIQLDAFENVPNVSLEDNPWQCDCRMAPFRLERKFKDQIICAQPAKFQGQKLKDINPEELICDGPTKLTPSVDAQNTFVSTANKPEITRYGSHESSPSVSVPALIGSVCGTAALSIVATVLITIWCKWNTKNPPSGPTSNIALSNINTTATVPTSGSLHDQTGQGQSLASTQPSNIKHPSRVRWPAASQTDYYEDAGTPPNPKKTTGAVTGSLAPHRDGPPPRDDDEPTYVEPDGAHYMTPEDVLYEMPANSYCEDDNRHYYQPLKKEQNLPTDASGYILVVPNNPNGQC